MLTWIRISIAFAALVTVTMLLWVGAAVAIFAASVITPMWLWIYHKRRQQKQGPVVIEGEFSVIKAPEIEARFGSPAEHFREPAKRP